jgi:Ser-tRNA(Ala) deacylase AlaX
MRTDPIYLRDCYLKEVEATVLEVLDNGVIVDKTVFYPGGGGQIHDTGRAIVGGVEYQVSNVFKEDDEIIHVIDGVTLDVGDIILLRLDWDRRYKIMKMHTSLHIIGAIMYNDYNVLITGSKINTDRARIDFPMEEMNKEVAMEIVAKADSIAKEGHEVKIYFLDVEDALKRSDLFRVADKSLYEKYMEDKVRIVEIVGVDVELDGGTHVKNTSEIGEIKFLKYESKGRRNRRIYITV